MEAWSAMKMVSAAGVRTAEPHERRYAIVCIHNADPSFLKPALVELLATKTPAEMHTILAKPDINITNMGDKKTLLPKVQQIDDHVKDILLIT